MLEHHASAIIGGTSFFGGKGRIFSVVIGGSIITGDYELGVNVHPWKSEATLIKEHEPKYNIRLRDDSPSLLTHLHGDQLATVVAQHVC